MAGGIDWFRWHHGSVNDEKFRLVAKRAGASVAEVIAVWASLLEKASAAEQRGELGRLDFEAMDCGLGLADGLAQRIHAAMEARELLDEGGHHVAAWEKRQPKREDDTAADRKRRQREREHELATAKAAADAVTGGESRDVTQGHAGVTHGHDRGEESREEVIPPVVPLAGDAPPGADSPAAPVGEAAKRTRSKTQPITLAAWLALCKAKGEKAIPPDDPVYGYAERIDLPSELLWLAWQAFKRRYANGQKRYRDWRAVYRRAVEENWLQLWRVGDDGAFALTTRGLQAKKVIEAEREGRAA